MRRAEPEGAAAAAGKIGSSAWDIKYTLWHGSSIAQCSAKVLYLIIDLEKDVNKNSDTTESTTLHSSSMNRDVKLAPPDIEWLWSERLAVCAICSHTSKFRVSGVNKHNDHRAHCSITLFVRDSAIISSEFILTYVGLPLSPTSLFWT